MWKCSLSGLVLLACLVSTSVQADVYEMRTYTAHKGKLEALEARFRDHTLRLFEKHGMQNIGYWVPTDGERAQDTLIYVLKHKDRAAAKAAWAAFMADPEWKTAYEASIADGKLVQKAESVFMTATDYSPSVAATEGDADDVFELRIYNTNEGKLEGLNARFRDHTLRLFEKHGIQNVAYWTPTDEPNSSSQLIYIIKHASREAAGASWKAFGSDEVWKKVAEESQRDGKFLSGRPISIYMRATDYSPMK